MKLFKQIVVFTLLFIMIFSLVACDGEYHYGQGVGSNNDSSTNTDTDIDSGYEQPDLNDDPTDDFTVTLLADGQPYSPRMEMYVYWNDGFSIHSAPVDKTGVARIDGLDGDYRVSLSAVPNEYTYDPNSNIATNDNRNIILNLYTLNMLAGSGTGLYDCYSFSKTGVYCAVINSPEDGIYFQYAPDRSGTYSIESWIDITEDNINPYVDVYYGSAQWKAYEKTIDDGGAMGSYTINFVHNVQIAAENISPGGGQATYTFVVKADVKNNKYPVTITFAVKRDGEFELIRPGSAGAAASGMAVPKHDFSDFNKEDHEYDNSYAIKNPEYLLSGNTYVFDKNRFKLWEKSKGGDGFYHVFDEEKYPETNGYGPILYAYITRACRFIDVAFTKIEYNNKGEVINSALSVEGGNYKHFIEGYTQLTTFGNINGGSYYCSSNCTCHPDTNEGWACTSDCTNCRSDCRRIPKELIGNEGYQAYANSDGLVPVTEELQIFLQGYSNKQIFFYDGKGTLENSVIDGKRYQATGGSGWLFACAYYEEK